MNTGQTDDWANFRGTYTSIMSVEFPKTVEVKMKWGSAKDFYNVGDMISFVEEKPMQRGELFTVASGITITTCCMHGLLEISRLSIIK